MEGIEYSPAGSSGSEVRGCGVGDRGGVRIHGGGKLECQRDKLFLVLPLIWEGPKV